MTAGLFSLTVDLSQLHHVPWIDHTRQVRSATTVLGHGFLWSDLTCYGVGIVVGALSEVFCERHLYSSRQPSDFTWR